jgi:O-antigen/teichoic acid export membrane protein
MQTSYARNYLKIYLWQGLSMVLNIGSMAIVTPRLTSSPAIYGIYALCISATIFLQYADIGFLGAAHKYASEAYARQDREGEMRAIGFAGFVLLTFIALYTAGILVCAWRPALLIKDLHAVGDAAIASRLLVILAAFSPITLVQRFLQLVYGIRVEDYIYQRMALLLGVFRIAAVYWFFAPDRYDIVGYFFATQAANLVLLLVAVLIARARYRYDFGALLRHVRFSRLAYGHMKGLAFSSLYTTALWVAFYELDLFAIGKLLGPGSVAVYAIGFTLLGFLRGILGTLYAPFSARFNHFRGLGQEAELKAFFFRVMALTAPLATLPIVAFAGVNHAFILSWVGSPYAGAAPLAVLLTMGYAYAFISFPASILIMAQERVKEMNLLSTVVTVCVWAGIFFTYRRLDVLAFAIFKFAGFSMYAAFYAWAAFAYLRGERGALIRQCLLPLAAAVAVELACLRWMEPFLPTTKGKGHLFMAVAAGGAGTMLGILVYSLFPGPFRAMVSAARGKIAGRLGAVARS